jgi:hypothetical protein
MPVASVAAATCFAAGFASILMGTIANTPLALAPRGAERLFHFTVVIDACALADCAGMCVCVGGDFPILTLAGIRQMIVAAIPSHLFAAVRRRSADRLIGLKTAGWWSTARPRVWRWAICMTRGRSLRWSALCWWWFCMCSRMPPSDRDCGHDGSGLGGRRGRF